jgi:hypothetical protein
MKYFGIFKRTFDFMFITLPYKNANKAYKEHCLFVCLWRDSPPVDQGLLIHEVFYNTHNDGPHSVGLLWTSDQPVAETST